MKLRQLNLGAARLISGNIELSWKLVSMKRKTVRF